MLKRFKFYMISGIVLVLLIVCNFVDKPIAKVGEVKDTVMMKLHTKESMAQIDGQTIYFKKIGEETTFTYAARVWWFFRWI